MFPHRRGRKKFWVRCLGPIEPEHKFWSTDKASHRVCDKCREKLEGINQRMCMVHKIEMER